jgi:hypothetical protein
MWNAVHHRTPRAPRAPRAPIPCSSPIDWRTGTSWQDLQALRETCRLWQRPHMCVYIDIYIYYVCINAWYMCSIILTYIHMYIYIYIYIHCIVLHCITLHTLHYITYIILHYITLHYINTELLYIMHIQKNIERNQVQL